MTCPFGCEYRGILLAIRPVWRNRLSRYHRPRQHCAFCATRPKLKKKMKPFVARFGFVNTQHVLCALGWTEARVCSPEYCHVSRTVDRSHTSRSAHARNSDNNPPHARARLFVSLFFPKKDAFCFWGPKVACPHTAFWVGTTYSYRALFDLFKKERSS